MMKRSIALILALLMLLSLLIGCGQQTPSTDGQTAQPSVLDETTPSPTSAELSVEPQVYEGDEELNMAYDAGFVPKELWAEMDATVMLADFTNMVRAIISQEDPSVAAAFDEYMGTAGSIDAPTDRSLAAIVLYYATYVLEIPEHSWFSLRQTSDCWANHAMELNSIMGDRWSEFKYLYCEEAYAGTFPYVYEGGYACDDFWDGSIDVAAYFTMLNRSTYDGRMYFDYDFEENTMHMDYAVSVEDAIRAVTRFYIMCHQEELFMSSMQEYNAASAHKTTIEDYEINDLVDSITVGIHYNHAHTDWIDAEGAVYIEGDNFYEKMLNGWEVFVSRDNQRAILKAYKEMGFNTIRIPITWTPYMDSVTNEIDEGYLDYVEYQVNLLLDEGFYVIINSHQDYASTDGACVASVDGVHNDMWMEPEYAEPVNARYAAMWQQIAERFKDYDEHLIFESLNEPQQSIFPEKETGDYDYQSARINELNQIFVDTVRSTGGNNEKRALVTVPLWGQFFMEGFVPPSDDYIMVSYHTYFSNDGAIGFYDLSSEDIATDNGEFLSCTPKDTALLTWIDKTYEQIRVFQETYNIPVIIGEYAPSLKMPEEDRIFMTEYVMNKAYALDCPIIFWDGYYGGDGDVGFYLLGKDEWRTPTLFETIMEMASQRD